MSYDPNNPQSYPQPAYAPQSQDSNGLAIASLVLGIASYVLLPIVGAITAIILGAIACSQTPRGVSGRGMAVAGIVLGIVNIVLCILAVIFFFWFFASMVGWWYLY